MRTCVSSEQLFKYLDWRHSSLLSESTLKKGFRIFVCCGFFCHYIYLFFFFSLCLKCLHLGKKNKGTLKIIMWKRHRGLKELYIIQIIAGFQSSRLSKAFCLCHVRNVMLCKTWWNLFYVFYNTLISKTASFMTVYFLLNM